MPDAAAAPDVPVATGLLVLGATPIGQPLDASPRLVAELAGADVVAAEDTRRLRRLCTDLDVRPRGDVVSYHDHNERGRGAELLERLRAGARVLLVTDAGMPSVSDPGYRLVAQAVEHDIRVTCLPGPSAVLVALAVSGLPVDRFCFEGFPPRKPGERARVLADLRAERRTMVFFEAPHRLGDTLAAMAEAFGDERPAAVCRELTKTHEEVRRGSLLELARWAEGEVRGEICVVVEGAPPVAVGPDEADAQVAGLVADGVRLKDACRDVAEATGHAGKELYARALTARARR